MVRFLVGQTLPGPGLALQPAFELEEGLLLPHREEGPPRLVETALLSCPGRIWDRCSGILVI